MVQGHLLVPCSSRVKLQKIPSMKIRWCTSGHIFLTLWIFCQLWKIWSVAKPRVPLALCRFLPSSFFWPFVFFSSSSSSLSSFTRKNYRSNHHALGSTTRNNKVPRNAYTCGCTRARLALDKQNQDFGCFPCQGTIKLTFRGSSRSWPCDLLREFVPESELGLATP